MRWILVVLVLVGGVRAAEAAADDDKQRALTLMRQGNVLLERGRGAEALEKFQQAYALVPSPKLNYNIGQAEALIPGHEARAYQAMARFLSEVPDPGAASLRAAAEKHLGELRAKVALVKVTGPAGASVMVDGEAMAPLPHTTPLVLNPGRHELALRTGAGTGTPHVIAVVGGETLQVALAAAETPVVKTPATESPMSGSLQASPSPSPAAPPKPVDVVGVQETAAPAATTPGWSWQQKTGAGLLGLAAVSLAVGIVQHVRYFDTADEFRAKGCYIDVPQAPCPTLQSRFDSANVGWVVGYAVGAALAAGGAGLIWLSPAPRTDGGMAVSGMSLGVEGRF